MRSECTESLNRCQEFVLDPRLLDLLRQHQDLIQQRLALTHQIKAIEREMQTVEDTTRCAVSLGVALTVVASN